ncbi:DUF1731 domain-containing protein [Zhihengliuella flava]|uniref:Uncharacterized protein (TIGR01777 family) n=1 Tax=Zhihengliuella flava TaxID=1285193 RepID=A0A931DBH9_9MICC|nr:DUF1731 domain-containing protein [Zhihengliuella flava]MBG6084371.1 uncharacterized protein (TIGR01777 family) [Zhihengliuella flava]
MAWIRTQEHFLALPASSVWAIVGNPARLPEWNPAVASLRPSGSLASNGAQPAAESADEAISRGTRLAYIPNPPLIGAVHTRTAPDAVVTELTPPRPDSTPRHRAPRDQRQHDGGAATSSAGSMAWRQQQPGGGLLARWEVIPHTVRTRTNDGEPTDLPGTLLRQRISVDGALSPLFAELAARPLASHFAENCARLYALITAEHTGSATPAEAAESANPSGATPKRGRRSKRAAAAPSSSAAHSPPVTPAATESTSAACTSLKVVIPGGTGFLGRHLAADLMTRGHDVVLLTRNPNPALPFRQAVWDGRTVAEWAGELEAASGQRVAVVNLAGKLVDVRPTPLNVEALRDSRVDSTRALVEASQQLPRPVEAWVQSSTTAIFSDAGDARLTEDSPLPTTAGALPQMTGVAEPWERAAAGANTERLHVLRTSIVLEQECPAYDRLAGLARRGLGGRVGSGQQWFSWIHLADWLAIVRGMLGLEETVVPSGIVHAAAPEPVRNDELMRTLRAALAPVKSVAVSTPAPLLRLGAVVLRTDPELALTGRHVTSRVLDDAGFAFQHRDLASALRAIVS